MGSFWGCGSAHGKTPNSGHSRTTSRGITIQTYRPSGRATFGAVAD